MNKKSPIIILTILVIAFLLTTYISTFLEPKNKEPDFFLGVDVAYADLDAIKSDINEIHSYTNLFIIGSTGISHNETKLQEICQYLYNKNMYFIIYYNEPWRLAVLEDIEKKYPEHFLGVYFDDEMGGKQLDLYELRFVDNAENYTAAANQFVSGLNSYLNLDKFRDTTFRYKASDFKLFTSDYSLYWFDYLAGYDVVFAEFGWNYSRQLNVALNRGAATIQDKEWGIIMTWTYNNPPYIESGEELYEDLVLAYDNGAKYIIVFDTNEDYTESILKEEHYDAIERFYQYTKEKTRDIIKKEKRVAFVLPKDYGYGFRGPEDKIWGLWEDDILSLEMSHHLGSLLREYGTNLDIIYGDEINTHETYKKYIFWNGIVVSDE